MGQRSRITHCVAVLAVVLMLGAGCDRKPAPTIAPATQSTKRTVASLVPAATDLIVAMDAEDQLVAVSNYCPQALDEIRDLPRVGDYQTVDWERLRQLRPGAMVIFQSPDRVSPGMRQSASELGIELANIRVDTIDDFLRETRHLGELLGQPAKAETLATNMKTRLDAVRLAVKDRPPVDTLILFGSKATQTVGRESYHDEVLTLAGGRNVIDGEKWMEIDRERLLSLRPAAVVVLLTDASPQVEAEARQNLQQLTDLPAVRDGRVLVINRWWTLVPGSHFGELAEYVARFLHPAAFPATDPMRAAGATPVGK